MPGEVVTVQVGQCGNALGAAFHEEMANHGAPKEHFREAGDGQLFARACLVDLEPKAVAGALRRGARAGKWRYDRRTAVAAGAGGGAGNNWAVGYQGLGAVRAMDGVRREMEACDRLEGVVAIQSLAGGTGSGLGAALSEGLKDFAGKFSLVNHCVWPHEKGDTSVQPYNTLLSLSALLESSDAVQVSENDGLAAVAGNASPSWRHGNPGSRSVSLNDMNDSCALAMAGLLLPARLPGRRLSLSDLPEHLCCNPGLKLSSLRFSPQSTLGESWQGCARAVRHMLATGSWVDNTPSTEPQRASSISFANVAVMRGDAPLQAASPGSFLATPWLYSGAPSAHPDPLLVGASGKRLRGGEALIAAATNCQACAWPIRRMLSRGYGLLGHRAYIHLYERSGLERESIELAFSRGEEVLSLYESLA